MARTDPSKRTCPTCKAAKLYPCRAVSVEVDGPHHKPGDLLLGYHEARVAPSRATLEKYHA